MEFENGIGRSQGEAHDKEPGPNTEDSCFKPVPLQNWFSGILNLKNEENLITPRPPLLGLSLDPKCTHPNNRILDLKLLASIFEAWRASG